MIEEQYKRMLEIRMNLVRVGEVVEPLMVLDQLRKVGKTYALEYYTGVFK